MRMGKKMKPIAMSLFGAFLATAMLMVTLWSFSAQAMTGPNGEYTVVGWGTKACSEWTNLRDQLQQDPNDHNANTVGPLMFQWFQGFLSGYNRYGPQTEDIARGLDAPNMLSWIDNYCQLHPTADFAGAATALIAERRNQPPPPAQ